LEAFFEAFDAEADSCGVRVSSRELMEEIARYAQARPDMIEAIRRLRRAGFRVAALTNNWVMEGPLAEGMNLLKAEFDVFVESSRTGLQKPDPRIYELTLQELRLRPEQTVFLDDIGRNLKTARELGMATIKVSDPDAALAELEHIVGIPLRTAV
jgi:epoxide hydrolase-like predicted phosphatase